MKNIFFFIFLLVKIASFFFKYAVLKLKRNKEIKAIFYFGWRYLKRLLNAYNNQLNFQKNIWFMEIRDLSIETDKVQLNKYILNLRMIFQIINSLSNIKTKKDTNIISSRNQNRKMKKI